MRLGLVYTHQAVRLRDQSTSASAVLGLQACATIPNSTVSVKTVTLSCRGIVPCIASSAPSERSACKLSESGEQNTDRPVGAEDSRCLSCERWRLEVTSETDNAAGHKTDSGFGCGKVRKSEASRHASTDLDGKKGGLGQASSRTWAWVGVETEGTR